MVVAPGQLDQLLYTIAPHPGWWDRYGPPHAGYLVHYAIVAGIITLMRWRLIKGQERRSDRARYGRPGHLDQTRRRPR